MMTDSPPDTETLVTHIEHLLMVVDDRLKTGTEGCQICENARLIAKEYRAAKRPS